MSLSFSITTQPVAGSDGLPEPEQLIAYTLSCTETGEFIRIIPQFGGIVQQLVLRKGEQLMSLLKTPSTRQALLADESYASAFLLPFASRIPGGMYSFEGTQYALPTNEPGLANAIHGLVHRQCFSVIRQEITDEKASLTLMYSYTGQESGYPFPFAFRVTYELSREQVTLPKPTKTCVVHVRYSVCNTGTKRCPIGFGWHPYFRLGNQPVDELTLTLPARSAVLLDDDLQPCGYEPMEAAGTVRLQRRQLDHVYAVATDKNRFIETILTDNANTKLIIGQQMSRLATRSFLICYTPPERDCIAIEPQTANVNAFNSGDGLTILNPGHELTGAIRIRLV